MAQIGWFNQERVPTSIIETIGITDLRVRSTARRPQ